MFDVPPYPIIEERPLDPAVRRWLGRSRPLDDLPRPVPGTIPVFEVQDGYVAFHERRHLGCREDLVVNAISVSIVDLRARTVTVHLPIPSRSAADEFALLVDFRCEVRDPELVAAAGLRDMIGPLLHYLRRDVTLTQLGVQYSVEDINVVREKLSSRVDAYTRLRAPHVNGMAVDLAGVRVVTPRDLIDHERGMRDERWKQDKEGLADLGEDRKVVRLRTYLEQGPAAVAGLAAARDQLDFTAAVNREYEMVADQRKQAIELLKAMPEDQWDCVPVDTQAILGTLVEQLTGIPHSERRSELNSGGGRGELDA
jgi:hypothetical protein